MRTLWIHRSVEILQGMITCHIHSPSLASGQEIIQEWAFIQKEMNNILLPITMELKSLKQIDNYTSNAIHPKKGSWYKSILGYN